MTPDRGSTAPTGGHWNGDEWRWRMKAPNTTPTIAVSEQADDVKKKREEKIRRGAQVVPFGFARVIPASEPVEVEPLLWEGED